MECVRRPVIVWLVGLTEGTVYLLDREIVAVDVLKLCLMTKYVSLSASWKCVSMTTAPVKLHCVQQVATQTCKETAYVSPSATPRPALGTFLTAIALQGAYQTCWVMAFVTPLAT